MQLKALASITDIHYHSFASPHSFSVDPSTFARQEVALIIPAVHTEVVQTVGKSSVIVIYFNNEHRRPYYNNKHLAA